MVWLWPVLGGSFKDLGDIDGVSMWDALVNNTESPRKELLHNIDDEVPYAALRYGDYKVVTGKTSPTNCYILQI